jgi:hypothetical protein
MKKFYFLVSALVILTNVNAQFTLVDFENLTLPAVDTFYTGEDLDGEFESQGVIFGNYYETTAWGYFWNGFAYSNVTDNTTAGFGNQYSAFAGEGANGSNNYAIYYPSDTITFPGVGAEFGNIAITNTTYAGISMRDGDAFGKQFGSSNGADGQPDGTNGEDYFFLTLYGWANDLSLVDSIEIYLADFRFSDNTADYILDEWVNFDISTLNGSKYFTFKLTSSDIGDFGINTPQYFAIDNIEYIELVNNLKDEEIITAIYPNPAKDILTINGFPGKLTLMDLSGRVMNEVQHDTSTQLSVSNYPSGIYYIRLTSGEKSQVQKIVIQ